jgi:hypothetical protein
MKTVLLLIGVFSLSALNAQNPPDTIIINNHLKYLTINGPGKGKVLTQSEIEKLNDSIYYNGRGYFKQNIRNYIIVKNSLGIIRLAGEYFHHYPDGIQIEYDQMGRKIAVKHYKYVAATTVRIKRKNVYFPAKSTPVGRWHYYEYKNAQDTVGVIYKTSIFDS